VAVQAIPGSHPRQSPNHIPPQIPVEVKMKKTKITDDCYLGKQPMPTPEGQVRKSA
jgi:hypothetical protein